MMMNEKVSMVIHEACCNELCSIAEEIEHNDGKFITNQQLDNAKDCVEIIKNLKKLSSMQMR